MKYLLSIGLIANILAFNSTVEAEDKPPEQIQEQVVEQVNNTNENVVDDKKESEQVLDESVYCSCIKTAKDVYGINIPNGTNASDLTPNSDIPVIGKLILLKYPNAYHVAVVIDITNDSYIIEEGNYHHCEFTHREIPFNYSRIVGFWTD